MKDFRLLAALAAGLVMGPLSAQASPEDGKVAFEKHGCWQCHGHVGQGGGAGPKLAPSPKPLEFYSAFVRNSAGAMPPYPQKILSNKDLTDIHQYLASIPKEADYKSIPLLSR